MFALNGSHSQLYSFRTHTEEMHTANLSTTFSSKLQTAWIGSTYWSQVEPIFQRGNSVVAEAITNKPSPPEDLPASYTSVSSFLWGYCWSNARLYSLIYLIMAMNKVCLPASRGKKAPAKYLSCVIKETLLERIREVLKWRNNSLQRAVGGRLGRGEILQPNFHCPQAVA